MLIIRSCRRLAFTSRHIARIKARKVNLLYSTRNLNAQALSRMVRSLRLLIASNLAPDFDWNGDHFRVKFGRKLRALSKLDDQPNERIDQLATALFLEAMSTKDDATPPLLNEEIFMLCQYVLQSFRTCLHYERILNLNVLWFTHMVRIAVENPILEMSYHLAYLHILLNTKQATLFFEYFDKVKSIMRDSKDIFILSKLPFTKILDLCMLLNDTESIFKVLSAFTLAEDEWSAEAISPEQWMLVLSLGVNNSHYDLVKLVYDKYIMREFLGNVDSSEDMAIKAVGSKADIFWSLSEGTLLKALGVLARAGDIELTMGLVETHFLHKSLRGEKGLTKELCINIITAYCYQLSKQSLGRKDLEPDQGFKVFLEVLSTFASRFIDESKDPLVYKDISDSFSHMLFHFQSNDRAINRAVSEAESRRREDNQSDQSDPHPAGRWEKKGSPASVTSPTGNTVANLETLEHFVAEHIQHVESISHHNTEILSLFVKCLLNHVVIHQNFTGAVKVLQCVTINYPSFKEDILDQEIFDIILFGLSRSSSAKQCAFLIYNYMTENRIKVSSQHYAWFINSHMRGYIHPGVQYFVYEYLKASEGHVAKRVLDVLIRTPKLMLQENEGTQNLVHYVVALYETGSGLKLEDLDHYYAENGLIRSHPKTFDEMHTESRRAYHATYDERDCNILRHIFN